MSLHFPVNLKAIKCVPIVLLLPHRYNSIAFF